VIDGKEFAKKGYPPPRFVAQEIENRGVAGQGVAQEIEKKGDRRTALAG
jgi:hypothetical protein